MPKQLHRAVALLEEQQQLARLEKQIRLEERAKALLLDRELRQIRAAMRCAHNGCNTW